MHGSVQVGGVLNVVLYYQDVGVGGRGGGRRIGELGPGRWGSPSV